jgi:hypothetical protein
MGLRAAYTLIDEETLDRLVELEPQELLDALEELEEGGAETVHLDKAWDGLHFLLTGASAASPIEDDPLSESVVGVHAFESDDYVGCSELDELAPIIAALERVDVAALLGAADFAAFARAELYPDIWADDPALLREELAAAFTALLAVHRRAAEARRHLVVSIF